MKAIRWAMLALILGGVLGCGGASGPQLKEGDSAPDFTLPADDGHAVKLSEFRDRTAVVLYFYPKDATPGCTKEACGFRDAMTDFQERGVPVFGISVNPVTSHQAFKTSQNLNFPLLADVSKEVTRSYGVLNNLGFADRVTFLVGRDGRVAKIFRGLDPASIAREVLAALPAGDSSCPMAAPDSGACMLETGATTMPDACCRKPSEGLPDTSSR